MSVAILTDLVKTYSHEAWKIQQLTFQVDKTNEYDARTNTSEVTWTSESSGYTYDTTAGSPSGSTIKITDANVNSKGEDGLLYLLSYYLTKSIGDGGFGNVIITASYLSNLITNIISSSLVYAEDGGVSDAYAISLPNAPTSLVNGAKFSFKAATQNTGACTLNVNGLGAKNIKDVNGADPPTGTIISGQIVSVTYDGTNFVIQSVCPLMNTTGSTLTTPIIASLYQDAAKTKLMTIPNTASDTLATLTATQTFSNKTHISPLFQGSIDGWVSANETWTYASASTITVPSGAASKYQKGDKIRFKQGAGYKYFYIITVADTLLTVTGGSDYTVATPTAITDNYYSHEENPMDFPHWLNTGNISVTVSTMDNGSGGQPATVSSKFMISNGEVGHKLTLTGTKAGTGNLIIFTPPAVMPTPVSTDHICCGSCFAADVEFTGAVHLYNAVQTKMTFTANISDNQDMAWGVSATYSYLY